MDKYTWVVVANKEQARIFYVERVGKLREVITLEHPKSGLSVEELTRDDAGRAYDRFGSGRHAMEPATSPKQKEADNFARELAHYLEKARQEGKTNRLILIAEAAFLGMLRRHLAPAASQLVDRELPKDLAQLNPEEVWAHVSF